MAHELEIKDGQASMMYYGEKPWHGLGTELDRPATAAEAIKAAKMDWDVTKAPLYAHLDGGKQLFVERYGVVRKDKLGTEDSRIIGVVGKNYTPLQNRDAFSFFDPIVGKDAAVYHTAGVLGEGRRVWILAKLPGSIRVVGDDITDKYLLLANSHDGTSSVQVKFTPVRVVCQNTLTMALDYGPTIRIPHTLNIMHRLSLAERNMGVINTHYATIEKAFQAMTKVQMNRNRLSKYLQAVFPDPRKDATERTIKRIVHHRLCSEHFFDQGIGNREEGVSGTLWAAYNGVTELVDHSMGGSNRLRALNSAWFGEGYHIKARAFREAMTVTEETLN